jgi:diguanylate cyclase (GGDEF)-like protein
MVTTPIVTSPGLVVRGRGASAAVKTATLGRSEVFSTLEAQELEAIARSSRLYRYAAGEQIFSIGEPGDSLYVVADGKVRMVAGDESQDVIAELVPGDTFGELDLLSGSPRGANARAEGAAVVLRFPGRGVSFGRVLAREPDVSARLLFVAMRMLAGRLRRSNAVLKENSPWIQEVRRQVYGDKLTGLYNKTYLEETLPGALGSGAPVSLIMFKPDNFKHINDTCGHEAGDAVLRLVAVEVSRHLGEKGAAVRYMGNEIAVLLAGTDREASAARARELQTALGALDLSPAGAKDIRLSLSFGIAVHPEHGKTADELIAAAHALPLKGRERGGNVILFPEDLE